MLATLLPFRAPAPDDAVYDAGTLAAFPAIVRTANASDYATLAYGLADANRQPARENISER